MTRAMTLVATGAPLNEILEAIVHSIEIKHPGMFCTILLLDPDGVHVRIGAAQSLPAFYNAAIDGAPIGPTAGSCGAAAYLKKRVIVSDIQTDPRWKNFRDIAAQAELNSCWSEPILEGDQVLGTFAIYHREIHSPSLEDIRTIEAGAQLASIAIQHKRKDEKLKAIADEREHLLVLEKHARKDAERANRIKDEFLATLSHELRTPLTAILSWVELLRMGILDPAQTKRGIEILEQSAKAQGQLIEDLLDISRIETGKLNLNLQEIDPLEIISIAIDSTRSMAARKSVQIEVHSSSNLRKILADPLRLQQVLWNLLTNAIKFSREGGKIIIAVEIVQTIAPSEALRICVQDQGKGIKTSFLPVIFERFTQVDSTTTRGYGGLGLGLTIVKKLVEMHRGTVAADSPGEDKGATFTVELPV